MGRHRDPSKRVYIHSRMNKGKKVYAAAIRTAGDERDYVGTFDSLDEARTACHAYLETGVKPPARKRGRKPGQADKAPRRRQPVPHPRHVPDRVQLLKQIWSRAA